MGLSKLCYKNTISLQYLKTKCLTKQLIYPSVVQKTKNLLLKYPVLRLQINQQISLSPAREGLKLNILMINLTGGPNTKTNRAFLGMK